jgi:rod shape-determining protein MreD
VRYWLLSAILLGAFLLQTTVAPYLEIGGVMPDFLVAVTVSYGLLFGWQAGLATGILAGFLVDLTFGRFVGMHVIAYALIGWASGLTEEKVFKDNFLLPCLGGLAGTIASQSVVLICLSLFGWVFPVWEAYRFTILPSSLYNMVLTYMVYRPLFKHYHYLRPDPRGTIILRRS